MSDFIWSIVFYIVGLLMGIYIATCYAQFNVQQKYIDDAVSLCSKHGGLKKSYVGLYSMKVVCNSGMVLEAEMQ